MESLYAADDITLTDLHTVYEALFLRALTGFEVFLEKHFILILSGKAKLSAPNRTTARMKPSSGKSLWEIIHQGDKYVKWIPYENAESRARLYLNGGKPFSNLLAADKDAIKKVTYIRNAIAHRSRHAMKQFKLQVIAGLALLPREKQPAAFLRSQVNAQQNRFEVYVIKLAQIAQALC